MTKPEKKQTIIRLVIFCVLAYLPLWVFVPIINAVTGETMFATDASEHTLRIAQAFGTFGMFAPALAHLLTRIFTKEGFKDLKLFPNFKGNIRYYLAAAGVKILESIVITLMFAGIFLDGINGENVFSQISIKEGGVGAALLLAQISYSVIVFFPAFGEEWGWRGYMMPKLMELMPKPAAVITGGVIWGLWHAPLTVSGHNFGTDYPGFPFLGIACMCGLCVISNAFFTLLTERTESIYPASIAHMVNNNCSPAMVMTLIVSENAMEKMSEIPSIKLFGCELAILSITGVVSLLLLIRRRKPNNSPKNS